MNAIFEPNPVDARERSSTLLSMISMDDGSCTNMSLTASEAPKMS